MKLRPEPLDPTEPQMYQSIGTLSKQINMIKECLKQSYIYTGEEEARLKRELRNLYAQRTELNKGNGFGN
tara:strand:+ start:133 stop:342 length:210 start_codon:yes stop_codon:yes gene_type:complete